MYDFACKNSECEEKFKIEKQQMMAEFQSPGVGFFIFQISIIKVAEECYGMLKNQGLFQFCWTKMTKYSLLCSQRCLPRCLKKRNASGAV